MSGPPPPPPPFTNRAAPKPPERAEEPKPAPPEAKVLGGAKLTSDETLFILKQHLRPDQISDTQVIKFVLEYLVCRSSAQAARAAGYASTKGQALRGNVHIHAAIEALTAKAVMKYGYDASEVIERVKEIAGLDPIEFENPDGSFKTHMSQIAPEARRAIKKFKAKNIYGKDANDMRIIIGQLIEVELWDKLKATELLGREKGVMKETKKVEHDVTRQMADVLLASERRANERMIAMSRPVMEIEGRNVSEQKVESESTGDESGVLEGED